MASFLDLKATVVAGHIATLPLTTSDRTHMYTYMVRFFVYSLLIIIIVIDETLN
jgi:hypothetical protein